MSKPSRIKKIEFAKKFILESRVEAIYTEKVVPSGTSARINSKSEFLNRDVIVIVIPEKEKVVYTKK